jgi:hypothetical protein
MIQEQADFRVKAKFGDHLKIISTKRTMTYHDFIEKMKELFNIQSSFIIKYEDDEKDQIEITNEEEYLESINLVKEKKLKPFKLFISPLVEGIEKSEIKQNDLEELKLKLLEKELELTQIKEKLNNEIIPKKEEKNFKPDLFDTKFNLIQRYKSKDVDEFILKVEKKTHQGVYYILKGYQWDQRKYPRLEKDVRISL